MMWLLRARRTTSLTAILMIGIGLAPLLSGVHIAFPSLSGGNELQGLSVTAVVALLAPATIGLALQREGHLELETAVRRLKLIDTVMVLAHGAVFIAAGTVGGVLLGWPGGAAEAVRDAAGLTGLFFLAAAFTSWPVAMSVPTCFLLVALLVGRGTSGIALWAWPLRGAGDVPAGAIAVILWAAGTFTLVVARRRF